MTPSEKQDILNIHYALSGVPLTPQAREAIEPQLERLKRLTTGGRLQ